MEGCMIDKYESRRVRSEIRRILLTVWDPIGVADVPECADEYDCCLGGVYELLTSNADDDRIENYLWKQATEHMGLSRSKESMKPTVEALRRIHLPEI
jgi:hypothetical protein